MKVGLRKTSVKKSIKARTTGKAKRQIKKSVSPGYGKKGVGLIKDPKKSVYNKMYSKTTKSIFDDSGNHDKTTTPISSQYQQAGNISTPAIVVTIISILLIIYGLYHALKGDLHFGRMIAGVFISGTGLAIFMIAKQYIWK